MLSYKARGSHAAAATNLPPWQRADVPSTAGLLQSQTRLTTQHQPLHATGRKPRHSHTKPLGVILTSKPGMLHVSGSSLPGAPLHASGNTLHAAGHSLQAHATGKPLLHASDDTHQGTLLHALGMTLSTASQPLHTHTVTFAGSVILFGSIQARFATTSGLTWTHTLSAAPASPCSTYMEPNPSAVEYLSFQHMASHLPACACADSEVDDEAAIILTFLGHLLPAAAPVTEGSPTAFAGTLSIGAFPPAAHIQPLMTDNLLIIDTFLAAIAVEDFTTMVTSSMASPLKPCSFPSVTPTMESSTCAGAATLECNNPPEEAPTVYNAPTNGAVIFTSTEDARALPTAPNAVHPVAATSAKSSSNSIAAYGAHFNDVVTAEATAAFSRGFPHASSLPLCQLCPLSHFLKLPSLLPIIGTPFFAWKPIAFDLGGHLSLASTYIYAMPEFVIPLLATLLKSLCHIHPDVNPAPPTTQEVSSSFTTTKAIYFVANAAHTTHFTSNIKAPFILTFDPGGDTSPCHPLASLYDRLQSQCFFSSPSTHTHRDGFVLSFRLRGRICYVQAYESITAKILDRLGRLEAKRTNGINIHFLFYYGYDIDPG